MPPGTREVRHSHTADASSSTCSAGTLTMEVDGSVTDWRAGTGIEIAPGTAIRRTTRATPTTEFLVISIAADHGDRSPLMSGRGLDPDDCAAPVAQHSAHIPPRRLIPTRHA